MPRVIVSGPAPDKKDEKALGWVCHISIRREYRSDMCSPGSDSDDVSVSSTSNSPSSAFDKAASRIRKMAGAMANQDTRADERAVYED